MIALIFVSGPLIGAEFNYRKDKLLGVKRSIAYMPDIPIGNLSTPTTSPDSTIQNTPTPPATSSFGQVKSEDNAIVPVSTQFGIVIEKINANARVIPNVDPSNEREYMSALAAGVAHAKGTRFPGEKGNIYLFSHSTDAPWNIIRFNAVFYLLREMEKGDRVIMFYNNRRYDYIVFDKVIAKPTDISYLTNKYDQSILTLQTCDPPGTLINRLIVRAKLVGS